MAQTNENDEEVLEQLVQAAETGDVAILRTLLTDQRARRWPRCRVSRTVNGTGHTGPSEFCATSI